MEKESQELTLYLERARTLRIEPNFYMSLPYLVAAGAHCYSTKEWVWIEADNICLFPPLLLHTDSYQIDNVCYPVDKIWAGTNTSIPLWVQFTPEFLDYEYIFNPKDFNIMFGGIWETFRKNSRKWPHSNPNWVYCDRIDKEAIKDLLWEWCVEKDSTLLDGELLAEYLLNPHSETKMRCLYNEKEELMAINAWDNNWKYINYRICISRVKEPFLAEFARWLFYTDQTIQKQERLVNDGGSLGNVGLEKFKDKMNPIHKNSIFSWHKIK